MSHVALMLKVSDRDNSRLCHARLHCQYIVDEMYTHVECYPCAMANVKT